MAMETHFSDDRAACAFAMQAMAGGGSITGRVTSLTEGQAEPLIGAIVLVQGSVRGTTTNLKGEYRIADLTPGRYSVMVSMVGYQRSIHPDIDVVEGLMRWRISR